MFEINTDDGLNIRAAPPPKGGIDGVKTVSATVAAQKVESSALRILVAGHDRADNNGVSSRLRGHGDIIKAVFRCKLYVTGFLQIPSQKRQSENHKGQKDNQQQVTSILGHSVASRHQHQQ